MPDDRLSTCPPAALPAVAPMGTRLLIAFDLSQPVAWGTMHYPIAVFGAPIGSDLGWTASFVHAGLSLALVVMAATSTFAGHWIDDSGGRLPMAAGCCAGALGCALLAGVQGTAQYMAAWALLGVGMRLALYDAAFASLAVLGGAASKRAMSQITLFGGLASTCSGRSAAGSATRSAGAVRWACTRRCCWSPLACTSSPSRPDGPPRGRHPLQLRTAGLSAAPRRGWTRRPTPSSRRRWRCRRAWHRTCSTFCKASAGARRWRWGVDAVRRRAACRAAVRGGVGAAAGRGAAEPAAGVAAGAGLGVALAAGSALAGAAAFAFLYGTGNGIATVTRGSMPLALFDTAGYGRTVGALLRPAFMLAAAAPVATAVALARWGQRATLGLALGMSLLLLRVSLALRWRFDARKESR